jgi:hypothetical protein
MLEIFLFGLVKGRLGLMLLSFENRNRVEVAAFGLVGLAGGGYAKLGGEVAVAFAVEERAAEAALEVGKAIVRD